MSVAKGKEMDTHEMFADLPDRLPGCGLRKTGTLKTRPSIEIGSSRFNVGFECLDRRMWHPEKTWKHVGALGAKWARVQTGWARCETKTGVYEFGWLDAIVDRLMSLGVQPWFNLGYGNMLYTKAPAPDAVGWAPIYSEEARKAWARFVEALVRHFSDRVQHYEIWNEPDLTCFWKPSPPNPGDYADLVALTAPVIRRACPGARVIGGAISSGARPRGLAFLEGCFQRGMGQQIDVLSYHSYGLFPEENDRNQMRALRLLLKRYDLNVELWQGESGCPSKCSRTEAMAGMPWTETKQAKWLLRRNLTDLAHDVDRITYFHMSDFHNYYKDGPVNEPVFFGLLRNESYVPKPSYYAFQTLCNLFDDNTVAAPDMLARVCLNKDEARDLSRRWEQMLFLHCHRICFHRKGVPLVAYWYPSSLMADCAPSEAPRFQMMLTDMSLSCATGFEMSDPVIVDPITQTVYQPEHVKAGVHFSGGDREVIFKDLPLLDYPLLVTGRNAVDVATE